MVFCINLTKHKKVKQTHNYGNNQKVVAFVISSNVTIPIMNLFVENEKILTGIIHIMCVYMELTKNEKHK